MCKKSFQGIKGHRIHESNMHNLGTHKKKRKQKKMLCIECGNIVVEQNMSAHIKRVYTDNLKLKCAYCHYETSKGEERIQSHEQLQLFNKVRRNFSKAQNKGT